MVKSYLNHELSESWGVLVSPEGHVQVDSSGKLAISPALESLAIWNIKEGVLVGLLRDEDNKSAVTSCCTTNDGKLVAAGYADGRIRVWDLVSRSCRSTLHGHRAAVTALRFNQNDSLLASGSSDTDVIIWDPVADRSLYRLRGHKDGITDLVFFPRELDQKTCLATSSKDTLVKFWDLEAQHCFQTLMEHRSQVWSVEINSEGNRLFTGCDDHLIRVFRLSSKEQQQQQQQQSQRSQQQPLQPQQTLPDEGGGDDGSPGAYKTENEDVAFFYGHLPRTSRRRVSRLRFDPTGSVLACQAADKIVDLYCTRTEAEASRKAKRRVKRLREKGKADKTGSEADKAQLEPSDEYQHMTPLSTQAKVASFCWRPNEKQRRLLERSKEQKQEVSMEQLGRTGIPELLCGLSDNTLASFQLNVQGKELQTNRSSFLHLPGHRSGIRVCLFSSDDQMLLTSSNQQIKVWNCKDMRCIRSLDSGYGLCAVFVPGNRHAVIGTKEGHLEVWDLGSASLLEKIEAHGGKPVWCMGALPDRSGIVTGGGDKEVKFWEYELTEKTVGEGKSLIKTKVLGLVLAKTLKVTDEVLSVQVSPNGKLVAAGLLDSTVKVFQTDSLKFFLSLYGHQLPVLCLDISSDSTLLVSGAADKNVKIWGLDFGDCHRSLFAHTDSVMNVKFVPNTHYFFTVSKDKTLKHWDADKFQHISTHTAHHAEVWALALNQAGTTVITGSNDRSLRKWVQTDEPLYLDEAREKELEEMFEEKALNAQQRIGERQGSGMEALPESAAVARGEADKYSLQSGEKLIEAIDLARGESKRWQKYRQALADILSARQSKAATLGQWKEKRTAKGEEEEEGEEGQREEEEEAFPEVPQANFLLRGMSPERYLLQELSAVPSGHFEEALLVLPFEYAVSMLQYLDSFIQKEWEVELCVRALMVLLETHQAQLSSNKTLTQTLLSLRKVTQEKLSLLRDRIGVNLAGLGFVHAELKANQNSWRFGPDESSLSNKTASSKQPKDSGASQAKKKKRQRKARSGSTDAGGEAGPTSKRKKKGSKAKNSSEDGGS